MQYHLARHVHTPKKHRVVGTTTTVARKVPEQLARVTESSEAKGEEALVAKPVPIMPARAAVEPAIVRARKGCASLEDKDHRSHRMSRSAPATDAVADAPPNLPGHPSQGLNLGLHALASDAVAGAHENLPGPLSQGPKGEMSLVNH